MYICEVNELRELTLTSEELGPLDIFFKILHRATSPALQASLADSANPSPMAVAL